MFSIPIPKWNDSACLQRAVAAHQTVVHVDGGADGTMAEPRDSRNRCVAVRSCGASVETLRNADWLAADPPAALLHATAPRRPVGAIRPPPVVRRDGWFHLGGDRTVRGNGPRHGFGG